MLNSFYSSLFELPILLYIVHTMQLQLIYAYLYTLHNHITCTPAVQCNFHHSIQRDTHIHTTLTQLPSSSKIKDPMNSSCTTSHTRNTHRIGSSKDKRRITSLVNWSTISWLHCATINVILICMYPS